MNRIIKFRIWNKPSRRMSYFALFDPLWRSLSADKRNTLSEYNNLMQFTGLLDKNKKEIYEGDIVAWRHIGDHKGVVKYDNGRFCVENFYIPIFDEPSDLGEGSGILEVIGNIYEDKNLIQEK